MIQTQSLQDASRRRNRSIFHASLSAVGSRGLVLLVNAISVPITVRYLGAQQFGVWITISTTLALLFLLDFGVSNAISNHLSEAYALDDKVLAGRYATTGFLVMVMVATTLGTIGAVFWRFIPWAALFHLSGQADNLLVSHAAAAAGTVFLLGMPAGLAATFLGSYQELRTANLVAAFGACANLAAIITVVSLHGDLVALVLSSAAATVGANVLCLLWLWLWHKPWLMPTFERWKPQLVSRLLRSGTQLFPLQLAGLIVFGSDNLVIAHYLGAQEVTPYSVTWKLVGYTAALQTVMNPALWPAYAEAWTRRDVAWVRNTLRNVMFGTLGVAALGCCVLIIWGRGIIRFWAGPPAVPPQNLLVLMCVWILLSTFMANCSTMLAATSQVAFAAKLSLFAAVLNLAASIWLVQRIGSIGVLLATIGSYLLVLVIPQTLQTLKVLRLPAPAQSNAP